MVEHGFGELVEFHVEFRIVHTHVVKLGETGGLEQLIALFNYTSYVSESEPEDIKRFLSELGSELEEAIMTAAQKMEARGEARAHVKVLLKLSRLKFGQLPDWVVAAVQAADDEQVQRWLELVITDTTLEEMFGLAAV